MIGNRSPLSRGEMMSRIRSKHNQSTEIALLRMLRSADISGWRRHTSLPGKPDFAFPKSKVAVFVDGCFWHGCAKCYVRPKTNRKFWDKKRTDNMARDRSVNLRLRKNGWKVVRLWEHYLAKQPNASLARIVKALSEAPRSS
jgi:DNA mismatch endonuclease (patch repair protein)